MIGIETFKTRIEAPKYTRGQVGGKYVTPLRQFMESDNMSMKFNCSSVEEANCCSQAMSYHNKRDNLNLTVWKRNSAVYVIKG